MTWDDQSKNSYTTFPAFKADGEWQVALVSLDAFITPEAGRAIGRQVRMISVGINSNVASNELEVSDLYLLGK